MIDRKQTFGKLITHDGKLIYNIKVYIKVLINLTCFKLSGKFLFFNLKIQKYRIGLIFICLIIKL